MVSELPVPARLSEGSYSEVLLALLLETYGRFEFWPSAPLKKAPNPVAKTQGGFSFSTRILAALQALECL